MYQKLSLETLAMHRLRIITLFGWAAWHHMPCFRSSLRPASELTVDSFVVAVRIAMHRVRTPPVSDMVFTKASSSLLMASATFVWLHPLSIPLGRFLEYIYLSTAGPGGHLRWRRRSRTVAAIVGCCSPCFLGASPFCSTVALPQQPRPCSYRSFAYVPSLSMLSPISGSFLLFVCCSFSLWPPRLLAPCVRSLVRRGCRCASSGTLDDGAAVTADVGCEEAAVRHHSPSHALTPSLSTRTGCADARSAAAQAWRAAY